MARQHESASLAEGRCPASGLILHRGGEAGPHSASCDMCDCFWLRPRTGQGASTPAARHSLEGDAPNLRDVQAPIPGHALRYFDRL